MLRYGHSLGMSEATGTLMITSVGFLIKARFIQRAFLSHCQTRFASAGSSPNHRHMYLMNISCTIHAYCLPFFGAHTICRPYFPIADTATGGRSSEDERSSGSGYRILKAKAEMPTNGCY